jgi:lipopolysaccharide cholinephosphotransferase
MDFLMPRKDFEKLVRVASEEFGGKYEFLEPRTTKGYVMAFAKLSRRDSTFIEATDEAVLYHRGIFIDIFPMDYWPQDKKKRDALAFRCYCLLRLCVLATYNKPKLPAGMNGWKKNIAYAGCFCVSMFLKLFRITTAKLYGRYLSLAQSTTPENAEHYVTDLCWCWIRKGYGMFGLQYRDSELFTQLEVPFEDITIPVPEYYDSYLKIAYKDYMALPPEDKRHCHAPSVLEFPEHI